MAGDSKSPPLTPYIPGPTLINLGFLTLAVFRLQNIQRPRIRVNSLLVGTWR